MNEPLTADEWAEEHATDMRIPAARAAYARYLSAWPSPEWPCKCGARNRLRDTTCRNCGDPKPEANA